MYLKTTQDHLAPATYWRDPHHLGKYAQASRYLADIDNVRDTKHGEYAERMAMLQNLVPLENTTDKVIARPDGELLDTLGTGTVEVQPLRKRPLYAEDRIGVCALDQAGKVHMMTTQCNHMTAHQPDKCSASWTYAVAPFVG